MKFKFIVDKIIEFENNVHQPICPGYKKNPNFLNQSENSEKHI